MRSTAADARSDRKNRRTGRVPAISCRSRTRFLVSAATLAATIGISPAARANYYPFASGSQFLIERHLSGAGDYAYQGPEVKIGDSRTVSDTYECPGVLSVTNWMAVPEDFLSASASLGMTSTSNAAFHPEKGSQYTIKTTNWSGNLVRMRVYSSCTTDAFVFPYDTSPLGNYFGNWVDSLRKGAPDYARLIRDAFHWAGTGVPAMQVAFPRLHVRTATARSAGNRSALRNGTNQIALTFNSGARRGQTALSQRPPAIYLTVRPAGANCLARQMYVDVKDGVGSLVLDVRCRGLKRGTSALLTIRPAIRRTFRLRAGDGTVHVHLDKPPGDVAPFVYLTKDPSNTPCHETSRRLRLLSRTFDLRLGAHCDRVARNAVGRLYVGGLLAR